MFRPLTVTDADFEQSVIKSNNPALVDFWAPWCGPCSWCAPWWAMDTIIEELAAEYEGKVTFAKVNIAENPRTAAVYSIASIPTVIIFKYGKPMAHIIGLRPKADFKENLNSLLVNHEWR